jgi:Resolvase, N terminal domain/Helix-turn-helix domain of resolvase
MKVFFDSRQSVLENDSFSPSASKPALAVQSWSQLGILFEIHSFSPLSMDDLALAHDRRYVEAILSCNEPNGFGNRSQSVARSTRHLLEIVDVLDSKGVSFRILNIALDTSTPTGKLMLSMLAAIGQFEREMMLERQREGITLAKQEGVYKGRKATAREKGDRMLELLADGLTKDAVAAELGVNVSSVYRIVAERRMVA